MIWKTLRGIIESSNSRRMKMLEGKSSDYNDEDRLSSFKVVSRIQNQLQVDGHQNHTASGVAQTMVILKMVRDSNLRLRGKPSNYESREDTLDDTINYIEHYRALEFEYWDTTSVGDR